MNEQKQTNYWIEFSEKFDNSKRPFSKSAYFTATVEINQFEKSVEFVSSIKPDSGNGIPERQEDDITSFSKNSRSRLLKIFSEISLSEFRKIYFVTLTYHHDWPDEPKKLKRQLDNYIKRLSRINVNLHYLWRLEYQKRGAPHFHFIFLIPKKWETFREGRFLDDVKNHWLEIKECSCSSCRSYAVKSEELVSYRKALYYVSKYVGKVDESLVNKAIGRRWGNSRDLPRHKQKTNEIPLYKFLYLKQLLYNFYVGDKDKQEYIAKTFTHPYSFYLFIDSNTFDNLFNVVLRAPPQTIFAELQRQKLIASSYYFDEEEMRVETAIARYLSQLQ